LAPALELTRQPAIIRGCYWKGKIGIVTGGYSGIGLETTRALRLQAPTII
jgi:hypothetical protein